MAMPRVINRRRHGRMRVVIGIDGAVAAPKRSLLRTLLVRSVPRTGTAAEALDEVLGALGRTRCELLVIDRTTGRVLGEAHRAALHRLEIAAPERAA